MMEEGGMMEGGGMKEGQRMMEGEGGGMMEGGGGGWCGRGMEGEHWNSLTWVHWCIHLLSSMGGHCVRGGLSFMGNHCHLGVGHHLHALEGCAGGGTRRPSWFQRDGLSCGGGHLHGWGVITVCGCLSFMGLWLGHRCGGQGVVVREGVVVHEGVIVCVCLWEVLVMALVACGG